MDPSASTVVLGEEDQSLEALSILEIRAKTAALLRLSRTLLCLLLNLELHHRPARKTITLLKH